MSRTKRAKKPTPLWLETILLLGVALVLAILIKTFFVQAFYIPSPSMEPQLVTNDRILVEKVSYWTGSPRRGDVVVFADPGGWLDSAESGANPTGLVKVMETIGLYPTGGHLVKRVIGVGGDRVACASSEGPLKVNGHALQEASYLPTGTKPCATYGAFHVTVPAGDLWVMGDNRGNSADSRAHLHGPGGGFVPVRLVVGKAFAVVWPFGHAQLIHRPATFADVPAAG